MQIDLGQDKFLKLDLFKDNRVVITVQCATPEEAEAMFKELSTGAKSGNFALTFETYEIPKNG